jgi:hypothetical protein
MSSSNAFWLLYLSIGCLIASVILWKNWIDLKENANVVVVTFDALYITVCWGVYAGLLISLFVGVSLIDFLEARWPFKNISGWWQSQYDKS